ncbi:PEP-CTERM-box response regulator transcription factor [Dyella sp. A6]|uniref:PEP-CTERM-box response regulator transcription factor n=1 Tax=Dyella aluminiiresistens TaxID=3069105 RepID=UPI002E772867|nr:PEP-CTERM-box response regulator transcription factor [Dyella sp. A6]
MSDTPRCLLIVEDDVGLQRQLRWSFEDYEVVVAGNRAEALDRLRQHQPAVVLQDLGLPPDASGTEEGFATITEILREAPHTKIIVVTGNGDRDNAVKSIGNGAYDFCSKPLDLDVLRLIVGRAFRVHELEAENRRLRSQSTASLEGIVGSSDAILDACRLVEKVSPSNATVLLLGETGTGKELFARAIHRLSPRRDKPFVAINCAAIPENLLEAELFGYEKGAYTGAHKQTKGKIEMAANGTLMLDEIGDMALPLQGKLLRFFEERVVERIGGRQLIPVDVRIVCATHQNLPEMIQDGRFREDLFYRVSEVTIELPPLRERFGDVIPLAQHFLDQAASRHGRPVRGFTAKALKMIEAHPWRGNVRQLENAINSAVIMSDGKQIGPEALRMGSVGNEDVMTLHEVRADAEKRAIQRALTKAHGNVSQAATLLGVSRPTLYDLLDKYGLKKAE